MLSALLRVANEDEQVQRCLRSTPKGPAYPEVVLDAVGRALQRSHVYSKALSQVTCDDVEVRHACRVCACTGACMHVPGIVVKLAAWTAVGIMAESHVANRVYSRKPHHEAMQCTRCGCL